MQSPDADAPVLVIEQPTAPARATAHFQLLDVLRGVAIILVVGHHVALRFPDAVADPVARFFRDVGWAGVDVFFAISGFLITGLLVNTRTVAGVKGFFVKRVFRIVPLYFAAIVVYAAASILQRYELHLLHRLWINVAFLTAWAIPVLGPDGVPYTITWSLSVEEFAYLLLGLFCLVSPARFGPFLWIVAAAALTIRCAVVLWRPFDPLLLYYFAPARLDAIAFGGLIALGLGAQLTRLRYAAPVLVVALFAMLLVFGSRGRADSITQSVGYLVFAAIAALLVGALARKSVVLHGVNRPIAWIGKVSYFVYLFHQFVIAGLALAVFAAVRHAATYWGVFAASVAITCAAAALSWRYFEEPLIVYGRRLAAGL